VGEALCAVLTEDLHVEARHAVVLALINSHMNRREAPPKAVLDALAHEGGRASSSDKGRGLARWAVSMLTGPRPWLDHKA